MALPELEMLREALYRETAWSEKGALRPNWTQALTAGAGLAFNLVPPPLCLPHRLPPAGHAQHHRQPAEELDESPEPELRAHRRLGRGKKPQDLLRPVERKHEARCDPEQGVRVIRFANREVLTNLYGVLEFIREALTD